MTLSLDRRAVIFGAIAGFVTGPALARRADPAKVTVVSFDLIRPSQGAVGMREVATKVAEVRDLARKPDKLGKFLLKEALPVVRGPGGALHLIDHHHLGRALWDTGRREVHVETMADLSMLAPAAFWPEMDKRGWLHAYDARGIAIEPSKLPQHVKDLGDDVYRSLAGAIRQRGAFTKTVTPFSEFRWADFLRSRIPLSAVERDFEGAVKQASTLARSSDASKLPGFVGR